MPTGLIAAHGRPPGSSPREEIGLQRLDDPGGHVVADGGLGWHLGLLAMPSPYTEDGRLTIDNNVSERTLRHQAIGRKNWLFLGSETAGPRAAVLCTILAGAKRHRIEPWCCVRELLLRLHADDPRLDEMLPDRWAAAHPEAVLTHRLDESRAKAARVRACRAYRRARH